MIAVGLTALVVATADHRRQLARLPAEYPAVPSSLATVVALLVAGLGLLGLVMVALRY